MTTAVTTLDLDAAPEEAEDPKLATALEAVRALSAASVDAVIPHRGFVMQAASSEAREHGADAVHLIAQAPEGEVTLRVFAGAHEQIAEKTGINLPYYRKMLSEEPALLARNVNTWTGREPNALRLLRMQRPLPGQDVTAYEAGRASFAVRAYLSDGYKVIDHESVLAVLAPELASRQARVTEYNLSPEKFHIRAVMPVRDLDSLLKPGTHAHLNELLSIGVSIRNSETGHAAAAVELFAELLRCTNGLTAFEPLRIAHLGKKAGEDLSWMSEQTRRLTDAADVLKLRDKVRAGFDPKGQTRIGMAIAGAQAEPLMREDIAGVLSFVQGIGTRFDLSKGEVDALRDTTLEELMGSNTSPANATRWTAAQAFTALARNTKGTGSFERGVELERIGWRVLTDPVSALLKADKAATN